MPHATKPPAAPADLPHALEDLWFACELLCCNGVPPDEAVLYPELLTCLGMPPPRGQQALLDAGLLTAGQEAYTLTQQGLAEVERLPPPCGNGKPLRDRPSWSRKKRVLSFRGKLVKRLDRQAESQTRLIKAFAAEGWAETILNPFGTDAVAARKLRDAVRYLNMGRQARLIEFGFLDKGTVACWQARGDPADA